MEYYILLKNLPICWINVQKPVAQCCVQLQLQFGNLLKHTEVTPKVMLSELNLYQGVRILRFIYKVIIKISLVKCSTLVSSTLYHATIISRPFFNNSSEVPKIFWLAFLFNVLLA